jgi:hypothetical protein
MLFSIGLVVFYWKVNKSRCPHLPRLRPTGFAVAVFFLPIPRFGQFALFCYESGIQAMNKLSQETSSGPFH